MGVSAASSGGATASSGQQGRHHLDPSLNRVRAAPVLAAGTNSQPPANTFRHSFATHLA